jgi:hypothetical protein
MDDKLQDILDSLPAKPPRSRLEPYRELIDELRRRSRTYREIAQILTEKCQVRVSASTIHDFIRVRSKAKLKSPKRPAPSSAAATKPIPTVEAGSIEAKIAKGERGPSDEVQQRISALKMRSAPGPTSPQQFHYDPGEPLRLPSKTRKNTSDK